MGLRTILTMRKQGLLILLSLCLVQCQAKEGKAFSLFSVVSFKNEPCVSSSGTTGSGVNRNGTCFTATECTDNSGTASGNCASGFGICCLFTISGDTGLTVSQNNTYIQNPSFPSVYTDTTALTYTINKCADNICAFRLDFETFQIEGPSTYTEASGGLCVDTFQVSSSPSQGDAPVICGANAGQHMYISVGPASGVTASLAFSFSGTSTERTWEIKVSQIECGTKQLPQDGCLQWFTGISGEFKTFNYDESSSTEYMHLASQDYNVCIRQEKDHCCVTYQKCDDTYAFTLDAQAATIAAAAAQTGTMCTGDYLEIVGATSICGDRELSGRVCGLVFSTNSPGTATGALDTQICTCSAPFTVGIKTDAAVDAGGVTTAGFHRGACVMYTQMPC